MKKLLITTGLVAALATGAMAERYPSSKASLGLTFGMNSITAKSDSEKGEGDELGAGVSFKMEEKIRGTHFYYGIGGDMVYSEVNKFKGSSYGLYPIISYNITKDLSVNAFAGLSYATVNYEDDYTDDGFGTVYGVGVDYNLGAGVTHGLVFRSAEADGETGSLKVDSLLYRIALKF